MPNLSVQTKQDPSAASETVCSSIGTSGEGGRVLIRGVHNAVMGVANCLSAKAAGR